MTKTCNTCKYWTAMPDMAWGIEKEMRSTGESICALSNDAYSLCYGQDGKAIITAAFFGCISWREKENKT